jgi:hypothetical protein
MSALTPAHQLFGTPVHEHRLCREQVSLIHVNSLLTIPSPPTQSPAAVAFARYPLAQPLSLSGLDFTRGVQARREY